MPGTYCANLSLRLFTRVFAEASHGCEVPAFNRTILCRTSCAPVGKPPFAGAKVHPLCRSFSLPGRRAFCCFGRGDLRRSRFPFRKRLATAGGDARNSGAGLGDLQLRAAGTGESCLGAKSRNQRGGGVTSNAYPSCFSGAYKV